MLFTSTREWNRVKGLAKDLSIRLAVAFGSAILLGLVLLKGFHYGTPDSTGQLCSELMLGGLFASFLWLQPAYFKKFTDPNEIEVDSVDEEGKPDQ